MALMAARAVKAATKPARALAAAGFAVETGCTTW
jgi:hypothetical protein